MREHKYPIQYQLKFSCDHVRSIVTRSVLFVGIQILTLLFIGYHPLLYGMILGPTVLYYLIDFMRMPRCIEIYQERIVIRRNVGRTVIRNIRDIRPFYPEDIKYRLLAFQYSLYENGFHQTTYGVAKLQFCGTNELAIVAFGDGTQQYVINYPHILLSNKSKLIVL